MLASNGRCLTGTVFRAVLWAVFVCLCHCQYFMYKLRDTTINGSEAWLNESLYVDNQESYESYLAVAAMVPAIVFMFLNVLIARWQVYWLTFSLRKQLEPHTRQRNK